MEAWIGFDVNPLYLVLHESIYCQVLLSVLVCGNERPVGLLRAASAPAVIPVGTCVATGIAAIRYSLVQTGSPCNTDIISKRHVLQLCSTRVCQGKSANPAGPVLHGLLKCAGVGRPQSVKWTVFSRRFEYCAQYLVFLSLYRRSSAA